METLQHVSRIGLGLVLTMGGVALLLKSTFASALPGLLERLSQTFIIAKFVVPYAALYYRLNALLFTVSGIFAIVGSPYAPVMHATAAVMFAITYDNPFLYTSTSDTYLRYVFWACHIVVFLSLNTLTEEQLATEKRLKKELRKKAKADQAKPQDDQEKASEAPKGTAEKDKDNPHPDDK